MEQGDKNTPEKSHVINFVKTFSNLSYWEIY
jgi:hypothetical protein